MNSLEPAPVAPDFGRTYWRSAPEATGPLSELRANTIDDSTFRLLADNIPTLCWVANGDGYIVWYNRRWHDYCGATPEQMEGWGWQAVHDPEVLPLVMERWTAAIAGGQPFEMTFPLRGADGVFRPFLTRVQPVPDATGAIARWFGTNTDVSDQVAAEDALRAERDRSQGVLDNIGEAFVLLDRDLRIVDMNAEALRLEERPREAVIGKTHWEAHPNAAPELSELYLRAFAERRPVALEHRYVWPDGRDAWIDMRAYPAPEGIAVFYRDITERKRAEAAIVESEERLRLVVDGAKDYAIFTIDPERRITSWSQGAARTFGYTPEEAIGRSADVIFTPEDRAANRPAIEVDEAQREGSAQDERWHIRQDGARIFMNGSVHPLPFDASGRERGFIKIARDETEQRRAAETLRATTARAEAMAAEQAAILGQLAEGVIVADRTGRISFVNEAAARIHGVARLDVEAHAYSQTYKLPTRDGSPQPSELLPLARAVLHGETVLDARWRIRRPDGSQVLAIGGARPVLDQAGGQLGAVLTLRDDTERSRGEAALRASEEFNRRILASSADCVKVLDLDARLEFMSEGGMRVMQVDDFGDIAGKCWPDFWQGDEHELARAAVEEATRGGTGRFRGFATTFKGAPRWWDVIVTPINGSDGRPEKLLSISRDITATKQAEEALRELNDQLEQRVSAALAERKLLADLVEGTDAFVQVAGRDFRWLAINRAAADEFERLYGVRPRVGDSMLDLLADHPQDQAAVRAVWSRALSGEAFTTTGEFGHPGRDRRHYEMKYNLLRDADGLLIGAYQFVYDVTQRVEEQRRLAEMEEALRQAQKMEAVGQLTGGIAHDFNNMLAVVIGSLDLLGRRLGDGDARATRYVSAAKDGARRAALLTQRLLAFSRQQPLRPEAIDVNKLVTGMSELIRGSLGRDIRLETVLVAGGWRTSADPNQLENVLLNLAVNARDAMPDGGRLTIETQSAHIDARYAAQHLGVPAGQYVLIAVTDTGSGMPAEVMAKAFDPFFTTKVVGKGTGLGLSQVYGFVKQSGGHVKIYSEPGQGTTVKVYLPRLAGFDDDSTGSEMSADMPLGESQEVVLVVEDEPAVRQFSVDALSELGYRALEADGASAALRLLDAHPEITLMFTDVVMPDVNGRKLADEARRRRPDLKVLFTTGYTRNAVVHNGVLDAGVELIGKPFTVEELAAKMREVLDAPTLSHIVRG